MPVYASCVQRFLISGQDLRIDAAEKSSACSSRTASDSILRFREGEWFRLLQSSRQRRIARLQRSRGAQAGTGCHEGGIILSKKPPEWRLSPPQQRSASESNLLCGKVEWFRLQQSSQQRRIACLQHSLLQRRIALLPHSLGVQAGTGCHEGGIILSKKPPEWRLSPPYQRSASEANLRRVNEASLCRSENESRRKTMRFSSYLIPEHSSVF